MLFERRGQKAVLDTNVIISGMLFPGSLPQKILECAIIGEFDAVTSPSLLEELQRTLIRRFGFSTEEGKDAKEFFEKICTVAEPSEIPEVVAADRDDDNLFAAAICGNAKIIVSGDKKVRAIKRFGGIDVYSPREFLDFMKEKEQ